MCKKLSVIVLFLFFVSCASSQPQVQDPVPSRVVGCDAEVDFSSRMACITKMVKRLENIENAVRSVRKVGEKRYDDYWVIVTYEDCYADFCRERREIEYNPTLWAKVKEDALKIFSGMVLGAGIVLSM